MKSRSDCNDTLPYAPDFFGINQPFLRWKSRIIGNRFERFRNALYAKPALQARDSQPASLQAQLDGRTATAGAAAEGHEVLATGDLKSAAQVTKQLPPLEPAIDCGIARLLQRNIGSNPPPDWGNLITSDSMATLLERLKTIVAKPNELQNFPEIADYVQSFTQATGASDRTLVMESLLNKEARVSSFLLFVARHKPTQLNELFFTAPQAD